MMSYLENLKKINQKEQAIEKMKINIKFARDHYMNLNGDEATEWAKVRPWVVSAEETANKLSDAELGDSHEAQTYLKVKYNPLPYVLQVEMLMMGLENINQELNPAANEENLEQYY